MSAAPSFSIIEDAEALGAIEEIVDVEGLDAIFAGRADLAVSMGAAQDGAPHGPVEQILRAGYLRRAPPSWRSGAVGRGGRW